MKYLIISLVTAFLSLPLATVETAMAAQATAQTADEFRTSKLVGSMVYNQANENIGSIEDIILKPDGTLGTVVLSVGGFLGIGDKYVAVPFSSLKITRENDSTGSLRIITEGSKDLLKALPDYQFYKA